VLTERYEALRTTGLARVSGGDRHGLALLLREGMAAWLSAWSSCSSLPPIEMAPRAPPVSHPTVESAALVALLASMALSTFLEQRP
jgi:hypothetical protein